MAINMMARLVTDGQEVKWTSRQVTTCQSFARSQISWLIDFHLLRTFLTVPKSIGLPLSFRSFVLTTILLMQLRHGLPGLRLMLGPWLCFSWQSGHLRHQRSADRIPTIAFFDLIMSTVCRKDKNK